MVAKRRVLDSGDAKLRPSFIPSETIKQDRDARPRQSRRSMKVVGSLTDVQPCYQAAKRISSGLGSDVLHSFVALRAYSRAPEYADNNVA